MEDQQNLIDPQAYLIVARMGEEDVRLTVAGRDVDDELVPSWACHDYGNWGHDWTNCSECLSNYERWSEMDPLSRLLEECLVEVHNWKKEGF